MIDPTWQSTKLTEMRGAWTYFDATDVRNPFALIANNCEFIEGEAITRFGFGQAYNVNEAMTSLDNWVSSLGNFALWFKPSTGLRISSVSSPSPSDIISETGPFAAVCAVAGARNYVALFNATGVSTTHGYVISYSSGMVSDKLFPPPINYTPSAPTEPAAGVVTKGTHYLGYRIIYRSGFKGRPCPNAASGTPGPDTFQPVSFTAAGLKNLSWTLNTAWPTGAVFVQIIMTPVSNSAQWYEVPNARAAVVGGTSHSVAITFDISDEELRQPDVEDAVSSQFLMTQTMANAAPFYPHSIFACGNRMAYVTTTTDSAGNAVGTLFVSERDRFQEIYAARSIVQCPELPLVATGCFIGSTVYLFGPNGTYATSDTGLDPVQWPTPRPISNSIGTRSTRGVKVWPDGDGAWVVDSGGLQILQGDSYASKPISYAQTDVWRRINWTYAHMVQVCEDPDRKVVFVLVPLDEATAPSHILSWNYSRGRAWDRADYSPWTIASFDIGAIGMIQNDWSGAATENVKQVELCVGPSDADYLLRLKTVHDTTPYRDNASTAISWQYRTMLLPPGNQGDLLLHHGGYVRAYGSGTLTPKLVGRDASFTQNFVNTITLAAAPGGEYTRTIAGRLAEQASLDFTMNTVDHYCHLSGYRHFYSDHSRGR